MTLGIEPFLNTKENEGVFISAATTDTCKRAENRLTTDVMLNAVASVGATSKDTMLRQITVDLTHSLVGDPGVGDGP